MTKSFQKMTAQGFTLIEVIISLGVFGLIVSGLFSLMPWGVENVSKIKDRSTALGLVDAVQVELERLGFSIVEHGSKRLTGLYSAEPEDNDEVRRLILVSPRKGGMAVLEQVVESQQVRLAKQLKVSPIMVSDELDEVITDLGGNIQFNKSQDKPVSLQGFEAPALETHARERWIDEKDRYFAIICSQFAKQPAGPDTASSRHFHHPSNGYLALEVNIQWPYKVFDPSEPDGFKMIEEKYRSKISFPVAITR
ncbi:prepilin-type N-terminal cleavage/methylation domain-containing protein [Opitutales bacterium]|nr:prepilin-type N-terminal cleavage/methylation domain-containing protein [Opitutales bacterium]